MIIATIVMAVLTSVVNRENIRVETIREFGSLNEAKRHYCKRNDTDKTNWSESCVFRGTTVFYYDWISHEKHGKGVIRPGEVEYVYDDNGHRVYNTNVEKFETHDCGWGRMNGIKGHSGHMLCYPSDESDFEVEEEFRYKDAKMRTVCDGKYVSVRMIISCPNACKPPKEWMCLGIVKRAFETGCGGYMSIRSTAKMRFGCTDAFPVYGRGDGRIGLICYNCRNENKLVTPQCRRGMARRSKHAAKDIDK